MSVTGKTLVTLLASTVLIGAAQAQPALSHKAHAASVRGVDRSLQTLYDQSGFDGAGIVSQNFEQSFDVYDCIAADDFIVPRGGYWRVREIDIQGTYFGGSGPSRSQNLVLYKNDGGVPGEIVAEYLDVDNADIFGSFVFGLGKGVRLRPGHYWISAQSNQDFSLAGEWGWIAGGDKFFKPAVWRNPGDGFQTGCSDWGKMTKCLGFDRDDHIGDLLFTIRGRAHDT